MAFAAETRPMFGKGMFTIDPNATPDQVAKKRAQIAAMLDRPAARYTGEGLAHLASGIFGGMQNRKLDKLEGEGRDRANAAFSGIVGGSMAGPMNILGVDPAYGQAPAMQAPVDPNSPSQIGADTMAALGKDPGSMVKQGLVARGMPEHIADGFVMNFQDESGLNPGINEQAPTVAGSRGGFGLAQWTGPRRRALEAYAGSQGKPVSDMNVQLDFLMQELQGPESAAWQKIAASQDAGSAGAAIVNSFLRPAEEHRSRREAAYTGGGNPAINTATPQIPMDQMMGLMSNPWLAPEQRAMLETMMGQQVQAGDPMRQVEVQKAQLELDRMQNPPPPAPPEEYTNRIFMAQQAGLQPGSPEFQNYLLTGELPNAAGNVPSSFAALDMQAQAAGYAPETQEYKDFMRNGGGSGTPAAFTALDLQAQAAGLAPGSAEYKDFMATRGAGMAAAAKVKGEAAAEAEVAAPADIATADRTLDAIAEVRGHPGRVMGTGASSALNIIPGTSGYDFQNRVKQLSSGAFLTAIDEMRGMGALSNTEGQTATAAVTRMDTATSEGEFLAALKDYEDIVKTGKDRAQKRIKATGDNDGAKASDMSDEDFLKSLGMGN